MRPLKMLFFPQDSKIIKDSFCSAISNQTTLFQMKMNFFPEKHLKILRNFRGATNKQNSWVGRTHCCSVPTFCFPFCAAFLTSTFSQTQQWRGLIQPITSEVSRSLWQQFYMYFFLSLSRKLLNQVEQSFWALCIYLSMREKPFSSLWTPGEAPKTKPWPLVFLFTVKFLCGFREDYQYSVTAGKYSFKMNPIFCKFYFSVAFLAFSKYWKGDIT